MPYISSYFCQFYNNLSLRVDVEKCFWIEECMHNNPEKLLWLSALIQNWLLLARCTCIENQTSQRVLQTSFFLRSVFVNKMSSLMTARDIFLDWQTDQMRASNDNQLGKSLFEKCLLLLSLTERAFTLMQILYFILWELEWTSCKYRCVSLISRDLGIACERKGLCAADI